MAFSLNSRVPSNIGFSSLNLEKQSLFYYLCFLLYEARSNLSLNGLGRLMN